MRLFVFTEFIQILYTLNTHQTRIGCDEPDRHASLSCGRNANAKIYTDKDQSTDS